MNVIQASVKYQYALVLSDNIVSFSKTSERHVKHVHQVLTLPHHASVTLKLDECSFIKNTIVYVWHVISLLQLEIDIQTADMLKLFNNHVPL